MAITFSVLLLVPTDIHTAFAGFPELSEFNGHCYGLTSVGTWQENKDEAVSLGGHLVTINDQLENDFVLSLGTNDHLRIGLNDIAQEGTYVWVSGEPLTFENWDVGEPNQGGANPVEEDYTELVLPTGFWRDGAISTPQQGVFEINDTCANVLNDSDGDGIPDVNDMCETEKETINLLFDEDGCPDILLSAKTEIIGNVFNYINDKIDELTTIEITPKSTFGVDLEATITTFNYGKAVCNHMKAENMLLKQNEYEVMCIDAVIESSNMIVGDVQSVLTIGAPSIGGVLPTTDEVVPLVTEPICKQSAFSVAAWINNKWEKVDNFAVVVTSATGAYVACKIIFDMAVSKLTGTPIAITVEDNQVIGGEIIPIEYTSLLLASVQSFSWMIPLVLSIIGIGLFVVKRKEFQD